MSRIRKWSGPVATLAVLGVLVWRLGTGPFVGGLEAIDGRAVLAAVAIGVVFYTPSIVQVLATGIANALGVH